MVVSIVVSIWVVENKLAVSMFYASSRITSSVVVRFLLWDGLRESVLADTASRPSPVSTIG